MRARSVAVTFDDGYADNLEVVAPILNHFGVRAAFYVMIDAIENETAPWFIRLRRAFRTTAKDVWHDSAEGAVRPLRCSGVQPDPSQIAFERCARLTGTEQGRAVAAIEKDLGVEPLSCGRELMMNWDQVRQLHRMGHIVGAHTVTHPNLAYVTECEARSEIQESKRRIEKEIGGPVIHFSYPHPALNPNWNEDIVSLCREIGFRSGVTTVSARVQSNSESLSLPRVYVPANRYDFLWHLERAL